MHALRTIAPMQSDDERYWTPHYIRAAVTPTIAPAGDSGLSVRFGDAMDPGLNAAVLVALLTLIRTLREAVARHRSRLRLLSRLERLSFASNPVARISVRELAFTTGS